MNTIPCIKEELVIQSFHANVRNTQMREKLSTHRIETTRELWELADRSARAEEGIKFPGRMNLKTRPHSPKARNGTLDPTNAFSSPSLSLRRPSRPPTRRRRKIRGATFTPTVTTCSRTAAR